jgi:hypothetical protein
MGGLVRKPKDLLSGTLFIALGLFFFLEAQNYAFGNVRRMGPGWFPSAVSLLLIATGTVVAVQSFFGRHGERLTFAWLPLVIVLASIAAFAVLLRPAGIVVATTVLVLGSAYAYPPVRFLPMLATGLGLGVFNAIVFVRLLGLPFPIFGPWLGPLQRLVGG